MNLTTLQKQIEAEMLRAAILELVIGVIALAVFCWIMYSVTKAAIRDGIRESGLVEALNKQDAPTWEETVEAAKLQEIRND